jgi:hypothetical protein
MSSAHAAARRDRHRGRWRALGRLPGLRGQVSALGCGKLQPIGVAGENVCLSGKTGVRRETGKE